MALYRARGFAPAFAGRPAHAGRIPLKSNMFYVYILLSLKDKRFYTGSTSDLRRRFLEHKRGKVKSTKNRLPIKLLCYEGYLYKKEALRREKFLKSSDGKRDLKKRLIESLSIETGEVPERPNGSDC